MMKKSEKIFFTLLKSELTGQPLLKEEKENLKILRIRFIQCKTDRVRSDVNDSLFHVHPSLAVPATVHFFLIIVQS